MKKEFSESRKVTIQVREMFDRLQNWAWNPAVLSGNYGMINWNEDYEDMANEGYEGIANLAWALYAANYKGISIRTVYSNLKKLHDEWVFEGFLPGELAKLGTPEKFRLGELAKLGTPESLTNTYYTYKEVLDSRLPTEVWVKGLDYAVKNFQRQSTSIES